MRITSKQLTNYLIDKLNKREEEYKRVMNIAPDGSDALCERKIDEEIDYTNYIAKNQDEYRYVKLGQLENILEGHNIEKLEELDDLLWYIKRIKDIEEELGIDLVTLIKAIKDGVYVEGKKKPKYRTVWFDDIDSGITDEDVGLYWFDIDDKRFYFKDYGKTWALTKEELE